MRKSLIVLAAAGALLLAPPLHAATRTWDGSSSASWGTAANWVENAVPLSGDDLVFPAGAMNTTMTNNLVAATAYNSITFSAGGYTVTGNGFSIVSSISATNNTGVNTIQPLVTLSATTSLSATSGGTLVLSGGVAMGGHPLNIIGSGVTQISGPITGSAVLTKGGTGDLTLSGANTYTGATAVDVGTLTVASSGALGSAAAGTTVAFGAALYIQGGVTSAEPITVAGSGILGNGALRGLAGGGTLSGPITFNGSVSAGAVTGETLTVSGVIASLSGSTPLTKVGPGTLVLTGANTYAGITIVSAGVLNARNTTALGDLASGTSVSAGAALELQGGFSTNEPLALNGTGVASQGALRNVSGTNAVYGNVVLNGSSNVGADAGSYLFLGGVVSGPGALTKVGAGNLVLTAANTFTGTTNVAAGTLSAQNDAALGDAATGTSVAAGAALEVQGGVNIAEPLTLAGTGVSNGGALRNVLGTNSWTGPITLGGATSVNVFTSSQLTVPGVIAGTGPLDKNGNGTLVLTAANTFTQAFDLNLGTAVVSGSLDPAYPTILGSGATLKGTGTTGFVNMSAGGTVSPGLGTGTLSTQGITFGASSTYAAEINATFDYDTIASAGPVTVAGNLTLTVPAGTDLDFGSTYTLIKNDSASPVTGTFAGLPEGATVTSSTGYKLDISYQGGDGNDVVLTRYSYGHNWTGAVSSNWSDAGNWQSNAPPVPGDSAIFGGSAVNFVSTNDLPAGFHLYAINIFSTGYTLNLNDAFVGGVVADMAGGSGTVTVNGATLGDMSFNCANGALAVNGALTLNGTLFLTGAGTLDVGAVLNGGGGVTKTGTGIANLLANNGYSGPTSVQAGALSIQMPLGLGLPGTGTSVAAGAGLWVNGDITVGEPLTLDGTGAGNTGALRVGSGNSVFTGAVSLANPAWLAVEGAANAELSGVVSGTALTKQGTGRLVLSGANTFTGAAVVNGGYLRVTSSQGLGSASGGSTVNPGASLELDGGVAIGAEPLGITLSGPGAVGALRSVSGSNSWAGPIQLNGDASIGVDAGTLTVSAAVNGAYKLAKRSAGKLVLNGNDGYVGDTLLQAGTLVVNGLQAQSAVVASANTTLGGVGQTGAVTATGTTVAPGQSPGVLAVGNLSLDSGSTYAVELNGTTPGSGYDRLLVTGTVSLGTATLAVSTGFTPTPGDTFTIIANDGGDAVSGTFAGLAEGAPFTVGNAKYTITYAGGDGNDVVLTYTGCVSDVNGPTVTPPATATVTQTLCN